MTGVKVIERPMEWHRCHFRLAPSGEEHICRFWLDIEGKIVIPHKLMFQADWIYDLDTSKVLKNKTGRSCLIPLGVEEVDRSWLIQRKFVRRRPTP